MSAWSDGDELTLSWEAAQTERERQMMIEEQYLKEEAWDEEGLQRENG